jgi:hypothetical protein
MATVRQENLADLIVENAANGGEMTAKEMLVNVGYATSVAEHKPKEIIEGKGVQEALAERGFTSENARRVVAEILLKETALDRDRLKAADMIFEVFGDKAPEKHISIVRKIIAADE